MYYVNFGATRIPVSAVSFGGNRLGDEGVDPAQWPPIVQRALELGVRLFDTSSSYNQGRSEAVLGEVTARWPERTYIATKVGVPVMTNDYPNREFTSETILRDAAGSLQRMQRDAFDLYMLHSPSVQQLETQDWQSAIERLRSDGKLRHFGISTSDHASGVWAIRNGAEFLQIEYSILDPTAEDELLPLAQQHNTGIMVRMPLARGLLTGKFPVGQPLPADQQWRRPRGDQLQMRLQRIEQLRFLERPGQTLSQAAIRYVLRHPAVHCAIPGARTLDQLEANVSAVDAEMTDEEYERIRALQAQWREEGSW
jgi:aryl-alcohol dehydrogenase-like predicted oxidoreductase